MSDYNINAPVSSINSDTQDASVDLIEPSSQVKPPVPPVLPDLHTEMNDEGNAARFHRYFRDKARWVYDYKQWFIFKNGIWQCDRTGQVREGT